MMALRFLPFPFVPIAEAQRCPIGPVRSAVFTKGDKSSKDQRNNEEGGNAGRC